MRHAALVFFLLLLALTRLTADDVAGAATATVFRLVEAPRSVSARERMSIASRREAYIAFDRHVIASISTAERLEIPLFDRTYTAERRSAEVRSLDDVTWRGKIVTGRFERDVVLTFRKGFVSGSIYAPGGVYEITPKGDGHLLMELDQAAFPECAGDVNGEPGGTVRPEAGAVVDSGDRIDVLVVYTPATRNILGGDEQARALAQQAIDITNTTYTNSKIHQRLRLVHAAEYVYTETADAGQDLSSLRANAEVAALRNEYNADLVAMIGEIQGACGIGYLMGNAPGGNPNNAYTFTGRSCAVGNLSFPHELGHNMGSHHNPENGGTPTWPFGFGHYVNGQFRTVMSYSNPCPQGCVRVPYFSNPRISFGGLATGLADERDNVRSINETARSIANYRYSGSSLRLGSFSGGETVYRMFGKDLLWTSNDLRGSVRVDLSRDEGYTWQTFISDTRNDGVEKIVIPGRPTRRLRLRIVSLDDPAVSDSSNTNLSLK